MAMRIRRVQVYSGILSQVDGRAQAQGHGEDGRPERQVEGTDDGRQDTAGAHAIRGIAKQELSRDGRCALPEDVDQQAENQQHHQGCDQGQQGEAEGLNALALGSGGFHERMRSERFVLR